MKYTVDDRTTPFEISEHSKGEMLVVKAGIFHEVFALEDNSVWYCIHGHQPSDSLTDRDLVMISDVAGNTVEG